MLGKGKIKCEVGIWFDGKEQRKCFILHDRCVQHAYWSKSITCAGYSGTDIVLNGAWIAGISSQTSHSLQWSLERATTVCLEQGGNPFSIHSRHCNLSFVSHTDILHMADKIAHLHQYIYIARIQTKTYTLYSSVHFKAQPWNKHFTFFTCVYVYTIHAVVSGVHSPIAAMHAG